VEDSLRRGEAPIASHLLYTQEGILDDLDKNDRSLGITAGHSWIGVADGMVVYTDFGISDGMRAGIKAGAMEQVDRKWEGSSKTFTVEYRKLYD